MTISRYDQIGIGYRQRRRPDPRIERAIHAALGDAASVVNVGAGAGSYEPADRRVVAVEPSIEMIRQRDPAAAPAVRATAIALPFGDGAFDAALAVLTIHHWPDWRRGLAEMARVASTVVVLTWEPSPEAASFWLVADYFPEILALDRTLFPWASQLGEVLGPIDVAPVPVPADCVDGFLGAYWRRPDAYLDPDVRGAMSTFRHIDAAPGVARLAADLASGRWAARHADLLGASELDLGYRLVTARAGR